VRFAGSDAVPVTLPHRWEQDAAHQRYSGAATYATSVNLGVPVASAVLDLGDTVPVDAGPTDQSGMRGRSFRAEVTTPVGEIAVVTVNGVEAGVIWSTPYVLEIGAHLIAGDNTIELTVYNTAANALAADTTVAEWAEASAERYGRRFRMQELDRAADGVSSGLLAVPTLAIG
jgi:hypothetical protein